MFEKVIAIRTKFDTIAKLSNYIPESEMKNIDEAIKSIPQGDLGIKAKIETPKDLYFNGLGGKKYLSPEALQAGNREWMNRFNRYISSRTGKEYLNYGAMQRDEQAYWERQTKPEEKIYK